MFARISLTTAISDSRINSRRTRGFISDIFQSGARKPITMAAQRQTPRPDGFRTRRGDDPLTDESEEILPGKRPPHVGRPRREPHAIPRTFVQHPGHHTGDNFPSPGSGPASRSRSAGAQISMDRRACWIPRRAPCSCTTHLDTIPSPSHPLMTLGSQADSRAALSGVGP